MPLFDRFFVDVIKLEGGYSNHKNDSGGETKFGVTKSVARRAGYNGKMIDLTLNDAKKIYKAKYWDSLELDQVAYHSEELALKLGDIAVNMGTGRAAEFLQRMLNVMNQRETSYKDIKVDRDIGPVTLSALKSYFFRRGSKGAQVMLKSLNCLQGAFYITLAERREKDESFVFGWMSNRID